MKKKLLSMLCMLAILCGLVFTPSVKAEVAGEVMVDGSYLTLLDSSVGTAVLRTKGVYLMEGDASISKSGSNRIYCYASTTANMTVDYVGVIVYVEQYNDDTGYWEQIDCWTAEDTNTYYVSTSKTLRVDKGYYYRVYAEHIAGPNDGVKDDGSSLTDGIFIPTT